MKRCLIDGVSVLFFCPVFNAHGLDVNAFLYHNLAPLLMVHFLSCLFFDVLMFDVWNFSHILLPPSWLSMPVHIIILP
jgi:hypothetical protein